MYAIICPNPGGPENLEWAEVPTPQPQDDEVLIKVAAAGINRSDILGLEVAGEVVAAGAKVTRWKTGDKVCALLTGGGYAEYAVAPAGQCLPIPSHLSMIEATALPEALITVYANLFVAAAMQPGETVLVHGGASGVGTAAIQMLKLSGAKIFVTAGSDEKCAACRKLGADLAINYDAEDFVAAVERETSGRGVDIVLDMIGGDYVLRNLAALAPLGRHISISTQHGKTATVDLRLVMQKRLIMTGGTFRSRPKAEKIKYLTEMEDKIWPWVASGALKPLIYKTWPIKNAVEAHKMMESGVYIGKIVLEVA
jgi:NADPH2:quinone reductase